MMTGPLDAPAEDVPTLSRRELVTVDGRTFAISDERGQMFARTHGLVHDDLRHLSRLVVTFLDASFEVLAASTPSPLSAVVVGRLGRTEEHEDCAIVTRRRWVADGLREDVHLHNTGHRPQSWTLDVAIAADFAHLFDVKAGLSAPDQELVSTSTGFVLSAAPATSAETRIHTWPPPDEVDTANGTLRWTLDIPPRGEITVTLTAEPVVEDAPAGLPFDIDATPAESVPVRRLAAWRSGVPEMVSTDPRWAPTMDQALADIGSLRIIDAAHPERPVIAAGAPWFMTLFGRDSLLSAWMTLPFDPTLASGVLFALAELQGQADDPGSDQQPGKILHELRRRGGGGPFTTRERYYGTVDATPLFVMLTAEAHRWGALTDDELRQLSPAVDAAISWILRYGDSNSDGWTDYARRSPNGLANQGWKDSWDGITYADGTVAVAPIALVEVQGYVYAALCGAAELAATIPLTHDPVDLERRARRLRDRFNETFWSEALGYFVLGIDGAGRQIDALTTNPGHALWTGIADPDLADRFLDHLMAPAMWTGWGLRTLADTMTAYDPLSYHNGSVWPHDTALCAAGAARYGRYDVVDRIVDGALDAAGFFGWRPPELFSGIDRRDAPMPVAYPSSCSPQAWASAAVLLLARTMLGLNADADGHLRIDRSDLSAVDDLTLSRLRHHGAEVSVTIADGEIDLHRTPA